MAEKSDSHKDSTFKVKDPLTDEDLSSTTSNSTTQKNSACVPSDDVKSKKVSSEDQKKRKKKIAESTGDHNNDDDDDEPINTTSAREIQKVFQKLIISSDSKPEEVAKKKSFVFWETQPVPKLGKFL